MSPEIESLLKLLDDDVALHRYAARENLFLGTDERWSDLAFRLRDEAVKDSWLYWHKACILIAQRAHLHGHGTTGWRDYAEPKHWIVAALVAKTLKGKPQ